MATNKLALNKSYLQTGFWLAVIIPGIFIFSQPTLGVTDWLLRFVSSFLFIFILWTVNFTLIDFKSSRSSRAFFGVPYIYLLIFLSFLFAIALIVVIGFTLDISRHLLSQIQRESVRSFRTWFFLCLRISIFNAVILLIKYLFDAHKEKQKIQTENERLRNESLIAQHEALKQKVNPHFLFNSLSTLKSLVKWEPERALPFIDELSSVYRYMLRHQEDMLVLVREEIGFLSSYLYLLKIRFGESLTVQIEVPESFLACKMPPNTLQLLAENSVKHNVLSSQRPLRILIYVCDDRLVVENNLQPKVAAELSSGLGLNNIRSRYLLAVGRDIDIVKGEHSFKVMLPLIEPYEYSDHRR
jgi:two-component system, LytTR family, sensor kinase